MRFFFDNNLSRWQIVVQVVRNWGRMEELAQATLRPFAFRVRATGTNIKPLDI